MGQGLNNGLIPGIPNASARKIIDLLATVSPSELILFGSRAKGNYREGSDIDIALKGDQITLDDRSRLILNYSNLNLPWKLDLVVYPLIEEPKLQEHIDRVGVVLSQYPYLVTGAAGFIGSRFVEFCEVQGIPTVSVDQESHFATRSQNQGLQFGKIVDRDQLLPWLERESPRLAGIIHLGAVTDTRETDLELLRRLNLDYTKALWNYAAKNKIPFVYASSAATYGDGAFGYDDNEAQLPLLKPLNAYGDSKQQFDLWALDQEKKGNHPPSWSGFKFFNVYGFGETHKAFMSSVVLHAYQQILERGQVTLFKSHRAGIPDGFQKRDFVFIEDVVKVLHFAMTHPIQRGIYNLGTGHARAFVDLARAVFKAMGKPENILFVETPVSIREKYQYFTEATLERLRGAGYKLEFTSLEDGVAKYVARLQFSLR